MEGTKAVINSTITPNMSFTQTSQKFGQWSDVRANTVYGLGFSSEAELTKFVEKFQEVKEATKGTMTKSTGSGGGGGGGSDRTAGGAAATANGSSAASPITSANTSPVIGRNSVFQASDSVGSSAGDSSSVMDPPQMMANASIISQSAVNPDSPSHGKLSASGGGGVGGSGESKLNTSLNTSLNNSSTESAPHTSEQQLKYENERLKMALAQR